MAEKEHQPAARFPDKAPPKRDIFDAATLLVGLIGAIVVVTSLVTTLQGSVESDKKAATALVEITRLADETHMEQQSLSGELSVARAQLDVMNQQLTTLQASSTSLQASANAERRAALASASAARNQSNTLDLQNKQLQLTFRPLIRISVHDSVPYKKIVVGDVDHDITWEVRNIGSVSGVNFGASATIVSYPNAFDIDGPENVMASVQDGMCHTSDYHASKNENEIAPQESSPQSDWDISPDTQATYPKLGGIREIWFGGCVAYKGLDGKIVHHVRFSYVLLFGPAPDGKGTQSGLVPTTAGNYSD